MPRGLIVASALVSSLAAGVPGVAAGPADGVWTVQLTADPPTARSSMCAAVDTPRHRLVVFGGFGSGPSGNDVWTLDLTTPQHWERLTPFGTPPPPRSEASMIYEPEGDRMIVYGGENGATIYSDVWTLSLSGDPEWTPLSVGGPAPPGRTRHAAGYDPQTHRMFVYGGRGDSYFRDLWALDLSGAPQWQSFPYTPQSCCSPDGSYDQAVVVDPERRRMFLIGGTNAAGNRLREVWALSLDTPPSWFNCSFLPTELSGATAVFDALRHRAIVYGGVGVYSSTSTVLALDVTQPYQTLWFNITPNASAVSAKTGHHAVYDAAGDRMVMFGGLGSGFYGSGPLDECVALPLAPSGQWTELYPHRPGSKYASSAVFDPVGRYVYLFGGATNDGHLSHETWRLDLNQEPPTWLPRGTETWPSGRIHHGAAWDSNRQRMLVVGGENLNSDPVSTVTYSFTDGVQPAWTALVTHGSPPTPRTGMSVLYDPQGDRLLAFGGKASTISNQLFELPFGGPNELRWSVVPTAGPSPPGRYGATWVYDAEHGRALLFGGRGGAYLNDVWSLDLSAATPTWTPISPSGTPPPPRYLHSGIYDSDLRRLVIYGGVSFPAGPNRDVWALRLGDTPTWEKLNPAATGPGATHEIPAAYDPSGKRMVFYGGSDGARNYGDVATLSWVGASAVEELATGAGGLRVTPNPAFGRFHLEYSVASRGSARLELFDVAGRHIADHDLGTLEAGTYRTELDTRRLGVSGMCWARLTVAGTARVSRFVIL